MAKAKAGSLWYDTSIDTKGASDGLNKLKSVISSGAKGVLTGITAITGAVTAGVTGFLALGEATQDTVEDMGKLETAFTTAGFSSETAKKSFEGMVGILGETDQSVEAVNHLAKLTKSEEELAEWTNIAAGVYATFGDSLPLEGLTEAANETAKVGQVTGPLADALNWAGISEEKFNEELAKCNSEQERATLITETLSDTYEEAGNTYSKINNDLIEARKAQARFNETLAEVGKLATPITTALKNGFSQLLNSIIPDLQSVSDGIIGIITGGDDAEEKLLEGINNLLDKLITGISESLPTLLETGLSIVTTIITGIQENIPLIVETMVSVVSTIAQTIISMLPQLLEMGIQVIIQLAQGIAQQAPILIPQMIDCLLLMIDTLLDNIDLMVDAAISLIMALAEGLIDALPKLIEKIPIIIEKLLMAIAENLPKLIEMGIKLIAELAVGLIKAIPQLKSTGPKIIVALAKAFLTYASNMIDVGKDLVKGLWNGILNAKDWLLNKVKDFAKSIIEKIKKTLGIASPSKVMRDEVGKFLPQGIAVGIEADTDKALASVNKLSDDIFNEMKNAMNFENARMSVSGVTGTVSQILSAQNNQVIAVNSTLELDGEKVATSTNKVNTKKDLQYTFS